MKPHPPLWSSFLDSGSTLVAENPLCGNQPAHVSLTNAVDDHRR